MEGDLLEHKKFSTLHVHLKQTCYLTIDLTDLNTKADRTPLSTGSTAFYNSSR